MVCVSTFSLPWTFIISNQLKVSRTNTLFGESLGGTLLNAM